MRSRKMDDSRRPTGAEKFDLFAIARRLFVAAGYRMTSSSIYGDFVLRRYGTDGSFDTTFGTDGRVTTVVGVGSGDHDGGHAVGIQPDGKIVVVGTTYGGALGRDLIVARYWP